MTSVHGVVNTLDRLGDRLSERDRVELRDAFLTQSERLRRLVDQLLDLSRLDADSVPIHPVAIAVREHVEEMVGFGGRAVERGGDQDPERLTARTTRPSSSACLESPDERASTRRPAGPGDGSRQDRHFRIAVQDGGNGVPAEFVDDLFERFSRSDEARARGLGSGLGLSIAR